jgi:hypothetical protein
MPCGSGYALRAGVRGWRAPDAVSMPCGSGYALREASSWPAVRPHPRFYALWVGLCVASYLLPVSCDDLQFLCPVGRAMRCEFPTLVQQDVPERFYALWVGLCVARALLSAPSLSCGDATGCEDRMIVDHAYLAEGVPTAGCMAATCANAVARTEPISPARGPTAPPCPKA